MQRDEELREEILQDVVRCMPDNLYFRQPDRQRMLLDILFVFCKLNPDVSYRQGMHELLAPILWVVDADAIDVGQSSKVLGEDATINTVFDADHVEHDSFALFAQLMQSAKGFYEQTTHSGRENPMVVRSRRIFGDFLPKVDSQLASHLESIEIVPQVFLMRWIRLLFGREFVFDDMLAIWDVILAEDPSFELVDHICLTMILRVRWQLIVADFNTALDILFHYPEIEKDTLPQSFALDALYLRHHMDHGGGNYIVSKHTGRALPHKDRPGTPPAIQRNMTTFSGSSRPWSSGSPSRVSRSPRNIEAVFQSTAKNLYAQSEKLGIGKAVRSAVDEVHRKAQEIRDSQTPQPPTAWRQRGARTQASSSRAQERIQKLEKRSKQLSKLLDGALNELWDNQKAIAATPSDVTITDVEKLSVAIAKVQFVQVYLSDPSLPLPEGGPETPPTKDDNKEDNNSESVEREKGTSKHEEPTEPQPSIPASEKANAPSDFNGPLPPGQIQAKPGITTTGDATAPSTVSIPATPPEVHSSSIGQSEDRPPLLTQANMEVKSKPREPLRPRPRLQESSLSWMLGQEPSSSKQSPFERSSNSSKRTAGSNNLLFGNDTASHQTTTKQRAPEDADGLGETKVDAEFDISSLRHGKIRNNQS